MKDSMVAVVTGSSSGIGFQTALLLGRNGFSTYASMPDTQKSASITEIANNERLPLQVVQLDVNNDFMDKNDRADEALRQLYQRNKNRAHVGTGYSKNKMFNGLIKNKRVINKKSDEIQPLSPKSSLLPGYNQSINVKLGGIVSKTDLLNIARKDDKFKENPTN